MKKKIYLSGALEIYGANYSDPKKWCSRVKEYFNAYSDEFTCVTGYNALTNACEYIRNFY